MNTESRPKAFVSGATRGIGQAIALGLAKAGYHIIASAKTKSALEALDDQIFALTQHHASLLPLDLNQPERLNGLGQALADRFGHIDLFVHSGGVLGNLSPISHYDLKDFERIQRINVTGTWGLIRELEPLLLKAPSPCALFLSSSESVVKGRAFWGLYGATKAALESMVRAWADEHEIHNLRVGLINPGPMRTRMRAAAFPGEDPQSLPHPDEIAPLILQLAHSETLRCDDVISFRDWKNRVYNA